jgi:hypothetical protein
MARTLRSSGAEVTSWNAAAGRTYANVVFSPDARFASDPPSSAQVNAPPLFVARITPVDATRLPALEDALAGAGRPAGILATHREPDSLVIELDQVRTPLALVLALIDVETGPGSARRIEPLLPLDDAALTALGAALLGEPQLDTTRLIETYIEPMLGMCP